MRRLLPSLACLVLLPLAGCGDAEKTAAVAPAAPPMHRYTPPPVVAKTKLVAKAERLCRGWSEHTSDWARPPQATPTDPLATIRNATIFARHVVVAARRGYHQFHALGVPRRGLARRRWMGFLSQYRATIDHLDELQAGVDVLDGFYAREALRRLHKSVDSAVRRGRRLGLRECLS